MANKKISELTELTEPIQSDVLAIVNSNETKKITVENIKNYVRPSEASTSEAGLLSAEDKAKLDNTTANYTTEEQAKLSGIEAGAEVNKVASVNGKTGAVVLSAGDVGAIAEPTTEGTNGQVLATNGAGGRSWVTVSGGGEGGTTDYIALSNKPKINNVELTGNKTSADLGLAEVMHTHTKAQITDLVVPTKTSDLTNDSNFIASTIVTEFLTGTQAQYDSLGSYNGTTLYLIQEG